MMHRRVLMVPAVALALVLPLTFGAPLAAPQTELGSDSQREALLDLLRELLNRPGFDRTIVDATVDATAMLLEGRQIFRFDTFGDEDFWGGSLRLHEAIAGADFGGIGPGLTPAAALALGLKVDSDALPPPLVRDLQRGEVDLEDPATTLALLELNAIVGMTGLFDQRGDLTSVGIQCALCHSTVDNSLAEGIGQRLDGWANRDLDIGAIIALAPDLGTFTDLLEVDEATVRRVLRSWGRGKFDAELILDGKAFRPDGQARGDADAARFRPRGDQPGARSRTGTPSSPILRWAAAAPSSTHVSMILNNSQLPPGRASATCAAIPT
jgi:hypothetical protein